MYTCICTYVYIYAHICICMYIWYESTVLLCVDLCLELRGSTTGCHFLAFFFLLCNTFGERPKLWPGPHSVRLCACSRRLGLSEWCLCACAGLAFDARWCTGCSLCLMSPVFWEGNALPAIHLHPVWIHPTISNSHTTYALDATCSSPINPVFISWLNRQKPWSFSPSLRERVCVRGGWGEGTKCVWQFGHFKCVWCSLT